MVEREYTYVHVYNTVEHFNSQMCYREPHAYSPLHIIRTMNRTRLEDTFMDSNCFLNFGAFSCESLDSPNLDLLYYYLQAQILTDFENSGFSGC